MAESLLAFRAGVNCPKCHKFLIVYIGGSDPLPTNRTMEFVCSYCNCDVTFQTRILEIVYPIPADAIVARPKLSLS